MKILPTHRVSRPRRYCKPNIYQLPQLALSVSRNLRGFTIVYSSQGVEREIPHA